ncbi:MAG: PqqD family protein [Peptoniphilaceae bacterium]|nr:PqqD family protein [Peptoniphilaceae bacterium]MDY3738583.1 PqqD family protein [Peptoniphilaceae bacterium]
MKLNNKDIPYKKANSYFDEKKNKYVVEMEHNGLNHKIAQKFFHKPKITKLYIEGQGNDVWENIDGKKTIDDIAEILLEKYGDDANPVYERIGIFIKTLYKNKFIGFK